MSGIAVVGTHSTVWSGDGWASEPTGSEKPGSSPFRVRCLLLTGIACGQSWPLLSPSLAHTQAKMVAGSRVVRVRLCTLNVPFKFCQLTGVPGRTVGIRMGMENIFKTKYFFYAQDSQSQRAATKVSQSLRRKNN